MYNIAIKKLFKVIIMIEHHKHRNTFSSINSRFKNSGEQRVVVTKIEWESVKSFLFSEKRQSSLFFIITSAVFVYFTLRPFKKTKGAFERVERKFTSLNSIDVERSTITKKEWRLICHHVV